MNITPTKKPSVVSVPLPATLPFQTLGEEIVNSVLHGFGALLAAVGLVLLVLKANGYLGNGAAGLMTVTAYVIFTAAMICMFLSSTLYHAIQHAGAKRIFRILDHSAIYIFIAGTYTPFCLLGFKGVWGWAIFGVEWALAITGVVLYALNCRALKKVELTVYILMGWAIVVGWVPLVRAIPPVSLVLLVAGGIAYSIGTLWYRKENRRGAHVTWHVFVLAGAICHWWSIWLGL
jgi:hemolysin III